MAHPFEVRKEIEVQATPEEVWEAIATGPGVDAWFMGRNEIEPREGGTSRMTLPGFTLESTVTVWDPPKRLVLETPTEADGRFMAFEYIVEGRAGGSTVVRFVHSGFLAGDDWETEYEGLKSGDPMYLDKLAQYLTYFRGRRATPVSAWGPQVDRDRMWRVVRSALGLPDTAAVGDQVRATLEGLPPIEGVVDYVSPDAIGVRTDDGLFRFIYGLGGTVVVGHHIYAPSDQQQLEQAWQAWIERSFA
jgi:uncharacterized protein YndB with AHSA1/START domain